MSEVTSDTGDAVDRAAADRPIPKPGILSIHAYQPGKAKAEGIAEPIKLSANENPLGSSPKAQEAYAEAVNQAIKEEIAYLGEARGAGTIRGMGPSLDDDEPEELDEAKFREAVGASYQNLGFSESAAKVAAAGGR